MSDSTKTLGTPTELSTTAEQLPNPIRLYGLLIASGFAGLGYQMTWTRMLATSLGHEIVATLAVLAAFFAGMAAGCFLVQRWLKNTRNPGLCYAILETLIGLWALVLVVLLPSLNHGIPTWIGAEPSALRHWTIAFLAAFWVLLPATLALGATLPAAAKLGQQWRSNTSRLPGLYAANTLGAALGTLVTTFFLLPFLGIRGVLVLFAAINIGVALLIVSLPKVRSGELNTQNLKGSVGRPPAARALLPMMFAVGLLGLGYEVLVIRVLSQVLEGTVYSFAAVLTIYLMGTSVGATLYHRYRKHNLVTWQKGSTLLLQMLTFATLLGSATLWGTETVYSATFNHLPPGILAGLIAELTVASCVFLLPTIVMGALFSHLASAAESYGKLSTAIGINTLGGAFAPIVFGLGLPAIGAKLSLIAISLGYLLIQLFVYQRERLSMTSTTLLVVMALAAATPFPLRFVPDSGNAKVLDYQEGTMAAVAVIEEENGSRHLAVNNHFLMGGTASRFSDHRQTHLPLLWHGAPKSALYLGIGTGITLQAAQYYPDLEVTAVELLPELPALMPYFGVNLSGEHWQRQPHVINADARRFVVADQNRYDVIIAEVFHPSRDGAGSLYTTEHFQAVKNRLTENGLFCQWLPLFQLETDTLKTITRSFLSVFPDAQLHLAHFSLGQPLLCLLGSRHPLVFESNWLVERIHDRSLQQQLVQLRLNSDFALLGGYLGGSKALSKFAGTGSLNTDDRPLVTYSAPNFVYGTPKLPAQRLKDLLTHLDHSEAISLVDSSAKDAEFARRLEAYWQARDVFLNAGIGIKPDDNIKRLLTEIEQPLLEAVRLSADFTPAYQPLLQMANSLAQTDPREALQLLDNLDRANPAVPWAAQMRTAIITRAQQPGFNSRP